MIVDGTPIYESNDLRNYKKRVNQYLKEHQDEMAIYKLKYNKSLTESDVKYLEEVLWNDLDLKKIIKTSLVVRQSQDL